VNTILLAAGCAAAYLVAYHTYARFLARKIFDLEPDATTPAHKMNDGTDYVPTKKEILFGHHYTSIAGTGPIVGPAIGIIWGWVPALIWVLFGSILMGAVHDFGALVVSMRNEGKSIGDIAGNIINPRVRIAFLLIIALLLTIVIAVFCLVISILFDLYPEAVLSIWLEIPIAIWLGYMIYSKGKPGFRYSLIGLVLLYAAVAAGTQFPIRMGSVGPAGPMVVWTLILLIYAYIASTLPVTRLLQPRDYINGHELFVVMGVLALGVIFSRPEIVAPAVNMHPKGAPPIWPFLFITVACGAISGFHSLVASGTTSKQIGRENHARTIGYGGMLMEGMLAVFVIIAVAGGIGLLADKSGAVGAQAWQNHYAEWGAAKGLPAKVGAFVNGSANMLTFLGIPLILGTTIMGVFVASFAGTTLDTATRLQRYVITELASSLKLKPLTNKHAATGLAVITAGALALADGKGKGGLLLWPLFGGSNQLLAALALLVITVYLAKKGKPIAYTLIPFLFMVFMTGWAMAFQLREFHEAFTSTGKNLHLLIIASIIVLLEIWMIAEAVIVLVRRRPAIEPADIAAP